MRGGSISKETGHKLNYNNGSIPGVANLSHLHLRTLLEARRRSLISCRAQLQPKFKFKSLMRFNMCELRNFRA